VAEITVGTEKPRGFAPPGLERHLVGLCCLLNLNVSLCGLILFYFYFYFYFCIFYFCIKPDDVDGLRSLGAIFHRELYPLTLAQVPVALAADGRVVNEDVFLLPIGADKSVSLHPAEPLDGPSDATIVLHVFASSLTN